MYTVSIKPINDDSFEVHLCETEEQFKLLTIQDLWTKISEVSNERYTPGWFGLILGGRSFHHEHDNSLLTEAGLICQSEITLINFEYNANLPPEGDVIRPEALIQNSDRTVSMERLADFKKCILQ